MHTRHRTPTIFNLSMVDVLCCALGCVILLWLLNLRSAREEAVKVGETSKLLGESEQQLQAARDERDKLRQRAQATGQELADAQARLVAADKDRTALQAKLGAADEELARLMRARDAAAKEKADLLAQAALLERLLKDKEKTATAAARKADDLAERLVDADARTKELRALADLVPNLRADLDSTRKKLLALEEELAASSKRVDALQGEKRTLADELGRTRAAAENRFAGITLTGRRVVFLVDMSGSMEYLDEKTTAPDKWTGVRDTLVKLMRSLPELEKFQVILFSNKISYLMGNDDRWIDFDPRETVQRVGQALAAIKPRGETNMYAALQAAFRFKAAALDTIYLLSDGLPNIGEGLSAEAAKKLSAREQAEVLSRHIRNMLKSDWNRRVPGKPVVRINAVGFFYESPDVGAFLWALARENDGSFVGMSRP
jgi:predicted  nucleic acid-binding Zn-ribbon protein